MDSYTLSLLQQIQVLQQDNIILQNEVSLLRSKLEPFLRSSHKYYEKNKDIIIQRANERLQKIAIEDPDKIKEYRRRYYLKRKEKLQNEKKE